jgi:hypothetical protein
MGKSSEARCANEGYLHEWRLDIALVGSKSTPKSNGAPQTQEIGVLNL